MSAAIVLIALVMILLLPPVQRASDESRGFMSNMTSTPPSSGPVPHVDLQQEISSADVIIVGNVTSVSVADVSPTIISPDARAADDDVMIAQVSVQRILAGGLRDDEIEVLFLRGKLPSRPWRVLSEGQIVLLFLRNTEHGYVPVVPTGNPIETLRDIAAPEPALNRLQAVAYELEQIITSADTDSERFSHAVTARSELIEPIDLNAFSATTMQDPVRRLAMVIVALANQQPEALHILNELREAPGIHDSELWSLVVQRISELRQESAVSDLGKLIDDADPALVRAAVVSLRQIRAQSVVPYLVSALDHSTQEVRYQAVMGLAELEPGINGGPAWSVYQRDEQRYLDLWKHWWSETQAE